MTLSENPVVGSVTSFWTITGPTGPIGTPTGPTTVISFLQNQNSYPLALNTADVTQSTRSANPIVQYVTGPTHFANAMYQVVSRFERTSNSAYIFSTGAPLLITFWTTTPTPIISANNSSGGSIEIDYVLPPGPFSNGSTPAPLTGTVYLTISQTGSVITSLNLTNAMSGSLQILPYNMSASTGVVAATGSNVLSTGGTYQATITYQDMYDAVGGNGHSPSSGSANFNFYPATIAPIISVSSNPNYIEYILPSQPLAGSVVITYSTGPVITSSGSSNYPGANIFVPVISTSFPSTASISYQDFVYNSAVSGSILVTSTVTNNYASGYAAGYSGGYATGYYIGYTGGYATGYYIGYTGGYATGYYIGYATGYAEGYIAGESGATGGGTGGISGTEFIILTHKYNLNSSTYFTGLSK